LTRFRSSALVAATIFAAACSNNNNGGLSLADDEEEHEHEDVAGAVRALVSDETGTLRLYNVADAAIVWSETFPGIGAAELTSLVTTEDGRFAVINLRGAENRARFLDSGVVAEPHDDHFHLEIEPPELLDYAIAGDDFGGSRIAHVVSHHERISVFFDGEPTLTTNVYAATIPLSNLTADAPEPAQINVGNIHHGVAVPAEDGALIMSVAEGGGTGRTGVRIYDGTTELAAFPTSCNGLHGYAVIGDQYLFGCANAQGGTLVVTHDHTSGAWTESQVDFPAGATNGISNFAAHPELPFALAPWGNQAFIRVDPAAAAMTAADVLDLPAPACGYALRDDNGEHLLVLTVDGVLRAYDSADWSAGPTLNLLSAFTCTGTVPILQTVGSFAYVADPVGDDLLEIEIHDDALELARSIGLTGDPRRMTLFRHPAGVEDHVH
jgi:hypothetical protein